MKQWSLSISRICVGFFVLFLVGCSPKQQDELKKPLRPVRTLTLTSEHLNPGKEFTAVVDASKKADLSFKVSGELVKFPVNQGDNVSEGQIIARLNERDIKVKLLEAESSFDKAKSDFSRAKNLIKSNTISQSEFDQLKAQYNSAKAKQDTARNDLEYTVLRASFDGIIAKKYTENFEEINAKQPIIALHDISNIYLKINVPESIMIRVKPDRKPPKLSAKFAEIEDREFPLDFKEIATQPDEATRTYEVTLSMPAPKDHTILPGMTAVVTSEGFIDADGIAADFYLPAQTVLKDSKGHFVYLLKDLGGGIGEIKRQNVQIGELTRIGIEIFAGLQEGDQVISAGMSKVSDGMQVKHPKG